MMRLSVAILTAALVTGLLVACSSEYGVPQTPSIFADGSASKMSVAPVELRSNGILDKIHAAAGLGRPDAVKVGIYASIGHGSTSGPFGEVYAYPDPDRHNEGVCSVGPFGYPVGIAVDRQGDLTVPDQGPNPSRNMQTITVYKRECGPKLGSVVVSSNSCCLQGVASLNAANGEILAAKEYGGPNGSVSVCTLSGGCTATLRTPHMGV